MNLQDIQRQIRGLESKMYFVIFFMFTALLASVIYNTAISLYAVDQAANGRGFNVFRVQTEEEIQPAVPKLPSSNTVPLNPADQSNNGYIEIIILVSILALGVSGWLYWEKIRERKARNLAKEVEAQQIESQEKIDILKWSLFRSGKYKFEIKYPDTWQISHSDDNGFEVTDTKNIITVSIIDFFAHPNMTFQGWLNRHLDSITKINGRDVVRWSTGNSEHFIIPNDSKEFAVEIDMNIKGMNMYNECIQIFNLILSTFKFTK